MGSFHKESHIIFSDIDRTNFLVMGRLEDCANKYFLKIVFLCGFVLELINIETKKIINVKFKNMIGRRGYQHQRNQKTIVA